MACYYIGCAAIQLQQELGSGQGHNLRVHGLKADDQLFQSAMKLAG
jgi:hypothetical protein